MKIFALSFILFIATLSAYAQKAETLVPLEDSIRKYSHLLINNFQADYQEEINEKLTGFIKKALNQENSIEWAFDSIPNVSFLTSEDKKLRVVTWTKPLIDRTFEFYGFTQTYNKRYKKYVLTPLIDKSATMMNPMEKRLTCKKWYGAHYYNMIQKKVRGGTTTYTLLGWKGVDQLTKQKVIEVITLRSNGDVVLGHPMFIVKDFEGFTSRRPRRIIFTYSARANMHMEYEMHTIIKEKKKKKSKSRSKLPRGFGAQQKISEDKVKRKEIVKKMIIFDRLVPASENMEGIYSYYIPASNIFDGFVYENKKWVYYADIDARNHTPEKPKKKVNYELFEENDDE
jgi:hypothetical protein